ncbi:FAD-dependent oxidoreductase [Nocardioides sp.]|uniref:NAD(P)/FAD-dependent oxidoreductase n=1 Tax=Nocardioides sp. TaxID=35761 RepID=UPI00262A4FAF|nr:FAD-dependent oxidoreductase [Nocardioides sp.]
MAAPSDRIDHVLILGNGIAGLTAADALRGAGFDGEVTIVGEEKHAAYSRPALSKALLAPAADLTAHQLPTPTHGATELLGVRATALDPEARRVRLDDGETLGYDRLVIATGSRARRLSDLADEVTLRGLDDAFVLRERIAEVGPGGSVIVVGGGVLGMEIASGALAAGCRVTVVSQGLPLIDALGEHLAQIWTRTAQDQGLEVVQTAGARLERPGAHTEVVLADGRRLHADVVVSAVGDLPNTEWLADSGLLAAGAGGGAIAVDERGLVRPDVAAVGDLAALVTAYGRRRIPLWSSAIEQAKVAAVALIRGEEAPPLAFQSYFWTEGFGLHLKAVGDLPVTGAPEYVDAGPDGHGLMRWAPVEGSGAGAAVALNHRIPIPRLRRTLAG